jgi:hypothetical protein
MKIAADSKLESGNSQFAYGTGRASPYSRPYLFSGERGFKFRLKELALYPAKLSPEYRAFVVDEHKERLCQKVMPVARVGGGRVVNVQIDEIYAVSVLGFKPMHDGSHCNSSGSPKSKELD